VAIRLLCDLKIAMSTFLSLNIDFPDLLT